MKRTIFALFTIATLSACSGSGTSTTARESETEGDSMSSPGSDSDTTDTEDPTASETEDPTDATTDPGPTDGSTTDPSATASDTDPAQDDTGTTTGIGDVTIVGTWLSEGENIAPILVQLTSAASITATFEDDTFAVLTVDAEGQEVMQAGVYIIEDTDFGDIKSITLEQSSPQTITAEGIFEIDNSTSPPTMRYEVVQTVPDVGAEAPSAEAGFGGTGLGSDLTQTFVWQE